MVRKICDEVEAASAAINRRAVSSVPFWTIAMQTSSSKQLLVPYYVLSCFRVTLALLR